MSTSSLLLQMHDWVEAGALRSLDYALAQFIHKQLADSPPAVLLAAALVSQRNAHGHVCLNLKQALQQPETLLANNRNDTVEQQTQLREQLTRQLQDIALPQWLQQLGTSPAVANHLQDADNTDCQTAGSPLVLAGSQQRPLLYLRRYWQYEQQIRQAIEQRLSTPRPLPQTDTRQLLDTLFPGANNTTQTDWQKIACLLAARNNFAIITGGPGTGKTTTVVRLLALLQGLQLNSGQPFLNIHLAAPTGKAAARLSESITGNIANLQLPEPMQQPLRDSIPSSVTTLHRLLGSLPNSRHFRHHAANPLPTDLVVVDEASMMDVEMMAQLVDALPPQARLILLGDKDQLASVEAGSVLGDLCQGADTAHYTPTTRDWITQYSGETPADTFIDVQGTPLQQATCMLRHSYRFSQHPGIGELASAVNSGTASPQSLEPIFTAHTGTLNIIKLAANSTGKKVNLDELEQLLVQGYRSYLECLQQEAPKDANDSEQLKNWALRVFAAHNQFQLLTAVRQGVFGVDNLNQLIASALRKKGLLPAGDSAWYHGRPLLVTRNDYSLKLMNGDIGICMQWPGQQLRVAFPDASRGIRWVLPSRLQAVETVFAMTVHKSQGSEFTHSALILPEYGNPVLTKELIYTGITRAKEKFTLIHSRDNVLAQTLKAKVERSSGFTPE